MDELRVWIGWRWGEVKKKRTRAKGKRRRICTRTAAVGPSMAKTIRATGHNQWELDLGKKTRNTDH